MITADEPEAPWREPESFPSAEAFEAYQRDRIAAIRRNETRREQRALLRRLARTFPPRALEVALSPALQLEAPAIARVTEWAASASTSSMAVLAGTFGCGKTVAATHWAARWTLHHGRLATFLRATELATLSRFEADARARWRDAAALVLDDLGAEYLDPRGSFVVTLDELVDAAYSERRPLVITTNLDAEAFRERYGMRVWDRLREAGTWIPISGGSLRGKERG